MLLLMIKKDKKLMISYINKILIVIWGNRIKNKIGILYMILLLLN